MMPSFAEGVRGDSGETSKPHFAPFDLTDGRNPYEWWTKWPKRPRKQIVIEAVLLIGVALSLPFLLLWAWDSRLALLLNVPTERANTFNIYATAWLGGILGGNTFALKWLYHSVAKGIWHRDRIFWRVSTPIISGALSLALTALVRSKILPVLSVEPLTRMSGVLAFAFVVGYFSDNAIAALLRLAERLLGESKQRNTARNGEHREQRAR
jgi:hypothetical protein